MKQKGLSPTLTLQELTRVLGLTPQRVNQLEREGIITKLERGLYPISAITDYCEHLRQTLQGAGAGAGLTAERAELVREQTLKVRFERECAQGEWLPTRQVEAAWAQAIAVARRVLLAFPNACADLVSGKSPPEAAEILKQQIYRALNELADTRVVADGDEEAA
jgi:phage terminase Nu1 subunit (DNA packaging protein)